MRFIAFGRDEAGFDYRSRKQEAQILNRYIVLRCPLGILCLDLLPSFVHRLTAPHIGLASGGGFQAEGETAIGFAWAGY